MFLMKYSFSISAVSPWIYGFRVLINLIIS